MTRTAIYVRISLDKTGKQAGVERQLKECRALARRLKWQVVETFEDNDISAYSGKTRPGFDALLEAIGAGRVDAIICWHPDRLYRRTRDLERLVEITNRVRIRTVNGGDIDLSNATGRMVAKILGSVAEQESAHKGERRTLANRDRAQAGAWRREGPRLFGWTQTGEQLEPEATAIRKAVTDVLNGRSIRSIATEWNEAGLRTPKGPTRGGNLWTNLTVRRVLTNPTHAGLRTYSARTVVDGKVRYEPREPVAGDWEPIIDPDIHRGLLAFLRDPSRRNTVAFERKHMGSGVYRCGVCGGPLFMAVTGRGRAIYRCSPPGGGSGRHVGRAAEPLDAYVTEITLAVLSRDGIAARLVERPGLDIAAMHAQRTALQAQKSELATLFTEGVLDGQSVRRESQKLSERISSIDSVLAQAVATSPAVQLLDGSPGELETRWAAASPDIRGKVINELMTVTVLPAPRGPKAFNPEFIEIAPR